MHGCGLVAPGGSSSKSSSSEALKGMSNEALSLDTITAAVKPNETNDPSAKKTPID